MAPVSQVVMSWLFGSVVAVRASVVSSAAELITGGAVERLSWGKKILTGKTTVGIDSLVLGFLQLLIFDCFAFVRKVELFEED